MSFNSSEYGWADMSLILDNQDQVGIRKIKYTKKADKEAVYAKGRNPRTIATKNLSYEGEIELLMSDYRALEFNAPNRDVLQLSMKAVINYGNPPDVMMKDEMFGIQFTESGVDVKQGDGFISVTLPFIALRLEKQV